MLYIIRHGQTDWNKQFMLQGRTDIPLNEAGRAMAYEARDKYADINIDICYSSPLQRAYETASIIMQDRSASVNTDERLSEISFGICEGDINATKNAGSKAYPLFHAPENYQPPEGAESVQKLRERTNSFYKEVVEPLLHEGKDVLVVGHGAMNCSFIANVLGLEDKDFWKYMTGNCQLMKINISLTDSDDPQIEPVTDPYGKSIEFLKW